MAKKGYAGISVPEELLVDVDRIVNAGLLGYRSRSEFVIAAVREKIQTTFNLQAAFLSVVHKEPPPPAVKSKRQGST